MQADEAVLFLRNARNKGSVTGRPSRRDRSGNSGDDEAAIADRGPKSASNTFERRVCRLRLLKAPQNARLSGEVRSVCGFGECVAGAGGFEPPYGGIKIRCLTAWRRPNARRTIMRGLQGRNDSSQAGLQVRRRRGRFARHVEKSVFRFQFPLAPRVGRRYRTRTRQPLAARGRRIGV